jgi:hypothetical protein
VIARPILLALGLVVGGAGAVATSSVAAAAPGSCSTHNYGNAGEVLCTSGSGRYRAVVGCTTSWGTTVGETHYGTYRNAGPPPASLGFCDSSHPRVLTIRVGG